MVSDETLVSNLQRAEAAEKRQMDYTCLVEASRRPCYSAVVTPQPVWLQICYNGIPAEDPARDLCSAGPVAVSPAKRWPRFDLTRPVAATDDSRVSNFLLAGPAAASSV